MSRTLARAFPPGDFLAEELNERDWSQADFAAIIGRPAQLISGIIAGKKEITERTATQFAAALGTSPEYWLNLQSSYQLWRESQDPQAQAKLDTVKLRAEMSAYGSLTLLRRRGFIQSEDARQQSVELRELLEIEHLGDDVPFLAAARRSNANERATLPQTTWLACARSLARRVDADAYDPEGLRSLAVALTRRVRSGQDWIDLPQEFAKVGVRLVYVEAFPSNKISGVSFLLDGDKANPVIALSGLGKRFDKIMFTLLHEIAHLLLGHVTPDAFFIDEDEDSDDEREQAADTQASQWALPLGNPSVPRSIRRPWVIQESERQGVHPLIVIGTLQHQGHIDWRSELVRGAERVDNFLQKWGHTPDSIG
ncbi:HigA family addiction module antidote protein [Bacillus sp. BGMRC0062]|nr:HigA family addiction module antidote protein [Bacillus sp. BGMRC0062]